MPVQETTALRAEREPVTCQHPDAGLFAILRRREALLAIFNNGDDPEDEEGDAMVKALTQIELAAMRYPITTPAGLAAYAGMVRDAMKGCMAGVEGSDHLSTLLRAMFDKIEAISGGTP